MLVDDGPFRGPRCGKTRLIRCFVFTQA